MDGNHLVRQILCKGVWKGKMKTGKSSKYWNQEIGDILKTRGIRKQDAQSKAKK